MNDSVAEIFGYLILLIAAALMAWEIMAHKRNSADDAWLRTPKRFRRRMLMSVFLAGVGLLIVTEARGLIVLQNISHLTIYVLALTGMAVTLFVLSIRDLGEMARNAEKYALKDLEGAIRDQQEKLRQTDKDRG